MSLILEALKKSEAERQLGRAPGLTTPVRIGRKRSSVLRWWPAALLVVLLAGAFLAWRGYSALEASKSSDDPTAQSQGPASASTGAMQPSGSPAVAASSASTAPATQASDAGNVSDPTVRGPDARVVATRETMEFVSIERESAPVPAATDSTAPIVVPEPVPAGTTELESTPSPDAEASAATSPEPETTQLPHRRDLTQGERSALPPLKLSMHVYTEAVDSRFVLIDGRRYAEGAMIAPSLMVEEIRRDGAVLNFNQKRFLLPRP